MTKLSNMGRYLKFLTVINEAVTGKVINVAREVLVKRSEESEEN